MWSDRFRLLHPDRVTSESSHKRRVLGFQTTYTLLFARLRPFLPACEAGSPHHRAQRRERASAIWLTRHCHPCIAARRTFTFVGPYCATRRVRNGPCPPAPRPLSRHTGVSQEASRPRSPARRAAYHSIVRATPRPGPLRSDNAHSVNFTGLDFAGVATIGPREPANLLRQAVELAT